MYRRTVLSAVDLGSGSGFTIKAVTCRYDHARWSATEVRDGYSVVLVRRGRFRRRAGGLISDIDPTVAYVGTPLEEETFAHPAGGDVCTWVTLTPTLWRAVAGDTARMARPTVYVDGRLDLAHRRLLAASRKEDLDYALAEDLLGLLAVALEQVIGSATPSTVRAPSVDRVLIAAARDAIAAAHPAAEGLLPLADLLRVSPFRLSRAFTRELGVSLTRYRNRVRVGRALDRLQEGETNLAAVAADLGFADQAHLCRTVRGHLGHTPTSLRRLLAPPT